MSEEEWKNQVDKEMSKLDWKDTTSCINWESAELYMEETCSTRLDDASSMKFAMENSAGPNWGTPGCHHSKNAMGDKEWFTHTMCEPGRIEMTLNKDPDCMDTFEKVEFYFDGDQSYCT